MNPICCCPEMPPPGPCATWAAHTWGPQLTRGPPVPVGVMSAHQWLEQDQLGISSEARRGPAAQRRSRAQLSPPPQPPRQMPPALPCPRCAACQAVPEVSQALPPAGDVRKLRPTTLPIIYLTARPSPGAPEQRKVNGKRPEWVRATREQSKLSKTPEGQVESPWYGWAGPPSAGAEFTGESWAIRQSLFLNKKTQDKEGENFAQETVAELELRPGSPYGAFPHSTHQPPLPRRPGFQNAAAHGSTQPQPCVREQAAPCCLLSGRRTPPPDVSQPLASNAQSGAGHVAATLLRGGSGGAVA